MAKPASRQELINYCLRKLGAPVLEINIAEEQLDDLVDDALQFFNERHFDGVEKMFLKYKITADDIERGRSKADNNNLDVEITTASSNIGTFEWEENSNFIQVPDAVIGIERVFKLDNRTIASNMFNINYQLFLNDIYWFSSTEMMNYYMTKRYLEDIDWIVNPEKQIRFNKRQNRLYIDTSWDTLNADDYLLIECYRILNPSDFTKVYNDSFLKMYLTSLIKRQWGQNLIKFQGVKLPGGVELNGRQIYDDAVRELQSIEDKMMTTYELPPMDLIGWYVKSILHSRNIWRTRFSSRPYKRTIEDVRDRSLLSSQKNY